MKALVEAGASIIGGCCGTTPDYIRMTKEVVDGMTVPVKKESGRRFLTSERRTVSFDLNDRFLIVGERINPTGKRNFRSS